MNGIFSSPKTTVAAILGLIALIATQIGFIFDTDPETLPNYGLIVSQIITFIALIFARDNDKSSEDVGTKEEETIDTSTNKSLPRADNRGRGGRK